MLSDIRNSSSNTPTIVVTGIGGPAGGNAGKHLKQQGYRVIGTDMRSVDSVADAFEVVPAANHPDFLPALSTIIHKHQANLLIPTVSEELPVVSRNKQKVIALGCNVVIAPYQAVQTANDKLLTAQCLAQHRLSVPGFLDGGAPIHQIIMELSLPLIAKPRVSRGGRGVILHTDQASAMQETRAGILFQQFMPGQEFDVNLYLDQHGDCKSCVVLRKTQLREGIVGNALAVERTEQTEVAELGIRACQAIGLTGPADIDIRLDAEGRPRLLEINARLGANVLSAREVIENLLDEFLGSNKGSIK